MKSIDLKAGLILLTVMIKWDMYSHHSVITVWQVCFKTTSRDQKTQQDANDLLAPGFSSHDAFAAITTLLSSTGGVRFSAHQLNMTRVIQQKLLDMSKLDWKRGGVGKL